MFKLLKIQGDSLYPFFKNGQRVFCIKLYSFISLKADDFVVFKKQGYPLMVKQIKYIDKNGYFVQGTDSSSVDSRDFGKLSKEEIKYKVLF